MARGIGKALIAFAVIAALLIIAALVITLRDSKFAPVPIPNPNGYDNLLNAANVIGLNGSITSYMLNPSGLAETVAKDAEALQLARTGLGRECRVPMEDWSRASGRRAEARLAFRRLAFAFEYEGRLAEVESRPADAAQSYLAITRVGQEITRGGVVIDAMDGATVEGSGLAPLEKLVASLNAAQCQQVILALDSADAKRETVESIVHQEKIWGRRAFGWRYYMHPIVIAQQKHRASCITVESDRTRKLMIALAARAFELEHGVKPKPINDLVPAYLKTIPKDAFTGKDMAYPP
jgi:hypothetical protein